jgi:RNA polymerase sigma-70 factor (ECF subfamily)
MIDSPSLERRACTISPHQTRYLISLARKVQLAKPMPPVPENPRRPRVPPLEQGGPGLRSETSPDESAFGSPDDLADNEGIQPDLDDPAQPHEQDGVMEDMATLAVNPGLLEGVAPPSVPQGSAHFAEMEDSAIMLELSAGNMAGFDYLIQKYRKPIVNFMYRMVHNQAVAEELAQEVFLRVYRSRETYRAEARFSTWLYRIATNLGVNHARDTRHERNASTVYLDETDSETGTTPDVADTTPGAEAGLLRRERLNAIREHVLALPERQQMAVLMHKYEGMDYKQIGDVLKLSESATKSLLFRAYQTLREKLKEFL